MAFQLNAGYTQEIQFSGKDPKQMLVLIQEAMQIMDWRLGHRTKESITAFIEISICSFGEAILIELEEDKATISSFCLMPQITALGKNKRNVRRFVEHLNLLWEQYTDEDLAYKYQQISIELLTAADTNGDNISSINLNVKEIYNQFDNFFALFNPRPGYFATPIIISLNVLLFLLLAVAGVGVFSPNWILLQYYGANYSLLTLDGSWWRLLTSIFMHAGIWHLMSNMWSLLFLGIYLEPIIGARRYVVFYLIGGILAGLCSIWVHPSVQAVGASGAIFCLYGLFIALLVFGVITGPIRKSLLTALIVFIIFNLLAGISANIDNAAHMGGLVTGLLIGWVSKPALSGHNQLRKINTQLGIIGGFLIIAVSACYFLPNTIKKYRDGLIQFAQFEAMALRCYSLPAGSTKEDISWEIKHQSIGFWHQSQDLLHQLDKLRLAKKLHARNQLLLKYCAYRIQNCQFELLRLEDVSSEDVYSDSIDINNERIQEIVQQIQL